MNGEDGIHTVEFHGAWNNEVMFFPGKSDESKDPDAKQNEPDLER